VLSVEVSVSSQVGLEVLESESILLRSGVGPVELNHELLEEALISGGSLAFCKGQEAQGNTKKDGSHL